MNKLGIEILDCPKLLKMQIAKSFPRLEYLKDAELRIIKLSHDKYTDQMQGKLDVSLEIITPVRFFLPKITIYSMNFTICYSA